MNKKRLILTGLLALLALGASSTGTRAADEDRVRWDERFSRSSFERDVRPADYLEDNLALLRRLVPRRARVLDIAAGEGRNAVYLAEQGMRVDAVDISPVGLAKAKRLAMARGVDIETIEADLESWDMPENQYDLVINVEYLQRSLFPAMVRALRPGGVILFETYTVDHAGTKGHPMKREYLLERNELLRAFAGLRVYHYEEIPGKDGAVARLIAVKAKR